MLFRITEKAVRGGWEKIPLSLYIAVAWVQFLQERLLQTPAQEEKVQLGLCCGSSVEKESESLTVHCPNVAYLNTLPRPPCLQSPKHLVLASGTVVIWPL